MNGFDWLGNLISRVFSERSSFVPLMGVGGGEWWSRSISIDLVIFFSLAFVCLCVVYLFCFVFC